MFKELLVGLLALAASTAVCAQGIHHNMGRAPTPEELQVWDFAIHPEGKELPVGTGTAKEGGQLYAVKCAACHGPELTGGQAPNLMGRNTVPNTWPFATCLWDYINRAMPMFLEGSLKPDEVYALTAFLLYKNNVIKETDVLNKETLPKVTMPNKNGYVEPPLDEWKPGMPRLFKIN
jgi:cytochrome c